MLLRLLRDIVAENKLRALAVVGLILAAQVTETFSVAAVIPLFQSIGGDGLVGERVY